MKTHRTVDELLGAIDALGLPEGSWVATDADGTLWAADVADDAWHRMLSSRSMREAAAEAMAAILCEAGWVPSGEVHQDAEFAYELFRQGEIEDGPLIKAMTFCFAGWSVEEVRVFAANLYQDLVSPRVYMTTPQLLEGLVQRGFRLVVVSGSPRLLVEESLRGLGVHPLPIVLGTEVLAEGGVLSAEMVRPITWREGKVEALRSVLGNQRLEIAFGDTSGDMALFRSAETLRVLVHPRPSLRRRAKGERLGVPWCLFEPASMASGLTVVPPSDDDPFG